MTEQTQTYKFVGRGFLCPEALAKAEELRGKALVDCEGAEEHNGVAEIRLVPYIIYCEGTNQMGYGQMRDREFPIRESWIEDGILEDSSFPQFTEKGREFANFVLQWAYPQDYAKMIVEGKF